MILIKELKSDAKIGKFYLKDIFFISLYWFTFFFLRNLVASRIMFLYLVFNFIVAIIMVTPSVWNPGKRMWQVILFAIRKDKKIYKPISIDERSEDFE